MYADKESSIEFNISKRDSFNYPVVVISVEDIELLKSIKKINEINVIEIEAVPFYPSYFDKGFDLKKYYWSKNFGYVRYEFKDGTYWELKKFIRGNKNILNSSM